ncbi:ABC transporter ATP-binding protein [Carbonactinospora thermoautotrophica]|nr:ABC transporter ATP-binding protein [Carbonactinospora thermoautotrophica]KWX01004.1 putative ABC-type Fe3+-siderophore transporter ATP-binding protein [Carbonactinospora thermoautotrophica]
MTETMPAPARPRLGAPVYQVERVSFAYGERPILRGLTLEVAAGEMVALVGRNGCGKSTLLRLLAGLLRPDQGRILLAGKDVAAYGRREIARQVAVLHQAAPPVPGLTVRQLVRQGRYAHRGPLGMLRDADDDVCVAAMAAAGVLDFADREVDSLSGGERQRVRLALCLAQQTGVLLLDEPTTFLDVRHQLEVLHLVRRLREERDLTVVMVLHDLGQAARFADRLVALRAGEVVADGAPGDLVTPELLGEVFGVTGRVLRDERDGAPICLYDDLS